MRLRVMVLLFSLLTLVATASASSRDRHNRAFDSDSNDCFDHTSDDYQVFSDSEEKTVPAASLPSLHINAPQNGGITVRGWNRPEVFIKLCKYVEANDEAKGKQQLASMHLVISGNEARAEGADGNRQWAHFVINVPTGQQLDLETHNGPLSLSKVNGTVKARATNGPISINKCSGTVDGEATNGPISVQDSQGDIRIHANNGPIVVSLGGDRWNGKGLQAEGQNGPVALRIPDDYKSGVEVKADGRSPFVCHASGCEESSARTWNDEGRMVHLGAAGQPATVRLSTHNGPVSIGSRMVTGDSME